ncbi:dihydrofolate reductase family protein [Actinomadura madurae]|nr:dihydrofolate reductase family protein [Actinomadura madurae]
MAGDGGGHRRLRRPDEHPASLRRLRHPAQARLGDTTVIPRAEAVAEITKLKEQDGQDILQYGFGPVSRTLVEHGLLDELRLWIHPVVVGPGDPTELLTHKDFSATFELAGTTTFETGVIIATYVPAKK